MKRRALQTLTQEMNVRQEVAQLATTWSVARGAMGNFPRKRHWNLTLGGLQIYCIKVPKSYNARIEAQI